MEELILRSGEVKPHIYSLWGNIPLWLWIIVSIIILVFIINVVAEFGSWFFAEAIFKLILATIITMIILSVFFIREELNPEYDRWVSDAHKLIENLPIEKYEIVYIKIDPEMTSRSSGVFFLGSGVIHTKIEKSTPVSIAYKLDDEVLIKTFWTETSVRLSEDDKPYVTFQNLSKDLGHGIKAGWYNPIVHLPKNYEFNDIK